MRVAIGPSSFASEDEEPLRMLERTGCQVVPNPYGRRLDEAEIIGHHGAWMLRQLEKERIHSFLP